MKRTARLVAGCAIFLFFVGAAERAAHFEQARGSALSEREQVGVVAESLSVVGRAQKTTDGHSRTPSLISSRSESTCGASSIGPGRTVPTVTSCGDAIPLTATRHQRKPLRWWVARARQNKRDSNARGLTIRRLQSSVRRTWRDESLEAIAYASTAYGVSFETLRRKASCETGGTFDPFARNTTAIGREHASGLFQFLPSTFRSTPFARFSIWDPYANALAAAYMHDVGRGGEWACR